MKPKVALGFFLNQWTDRMLREIKRYHQGHEAQLVIAQNTKLQPLREIWFTFIFAVVLLGRWIIC